MQIYELGYLVLPSIAEDALSGVEAKLKAAIARVGGTEIASESPEHIDLAYSMTKTIGASRYVVDEAYIGWVKFEAEAAKVEDLRDEVTQVEEVLRFMIVKTSQETTFTFAQAREALAEKMAKEDEKEGEEAPKEAVVE